MPDFRKSYSNAEPVLVRTKAEAIRVERGGNSAGIPKSVYEMILEYHRQFGMINQVPNVQADRISYIKSYYRNMVVRNPYFPLELNAELVLSMFFEDVIVGYVTDIYPNIRSQISAFKAWYEKAKVKVRAEHDRLYPPKFKAVQAKPRRTPEDALDLTKEEAIEALENLKIVKKNWSSLLQIAPNDYYKKLRNTLAHYGIAYSI